MADEQAQRAPVAADDLQVALGAAGDFVPGIQAGLLRAGRVLLIERDPPARRAVAHAGEDVDDRTLAVQGIAAGRPRRPVAVNLLEPLAVDAFAQPRLYLHHVLIAQLRWPMTRPACVGQHHPT